MKDIRSKKAYGSAYNARLDFWKLVFTLVIVIFHAGEIVNGNEYLQSGASAVEFFFIVTGVLLATSVDKKPKLEKGRLAEDTSKFMIHRIKGIMPYYIFAYIMSAIVYFAYYLQEAHSLKEILKTITMAIPNFLLLSTTGINQTNILGTTWYISAMFFAMVMMYPLLRLNCKFYIKIIAPTISLLLTGYLINKYGDFALSYSSDFMVTKEILRALVGMNLGCFAYAVSKYLKKLSLTKISQILLSIVEVGCYISAILAMHYFDADYVAILLFLFFVAVTITVSQQGILSPVFNNEAVRLTNKFSLALYLCHSPVRRTIAEWDVELTMWETSGILLVGSTIVAIICMIMTSYIYRLIRNGRLKKLFINT